jgi:hypothetical protein
MKSEHVKDSKTSYDRQIDYNIETSYLWLRQHNLSLVVFQHHLELDQRMQIGYARRTLERI